MTEKVQGRLPAFSFEEKVLAFWAKVDRSGGPDACWTWLGAITAKWGYGCFGVAQGVTRGAHKLAWLLTNGDTKGLCVLHRCDNRVCVNPAHLFLGTKQDNMDDKVAKRRTISILTPEAVREIRAAFAEIKGKAPYGFNQRLAEKYGVKDKTIWEVRKGINWSHVK